jgi:hypothetical protein
MQPVRGIPDVKTSTKKSFSPGDLSSQDFIVKDA